MFIRRLLLTVFSFLLILFIGFNFSVLPVTAATCSGNHCHALDPQDTGCNAEKDVLEKRTISTSNGVPLGSVEMRWSRSCRTKWSRVTSLNVQPSLSAFLTRKSGNPPFVVKTAKGTLVWSPMFYGGQENTDKVQACGTIAGSSRCTSLY